MKALTKNVTMNAHNEICVTYEIKGRFAALIVFDTKVNMLRSLCDDKYSIMQFEGGAQDAARKFVRELKRA